MPFGRRGFSLRSLVLYIFIIFGLLAVFGLFFLPLWKLAEVAFQEEGQLSLGIFWGLLTDPKTLKVIWDTIYINILSSFFATVIGVIMAYFVAYADIRGKKFILTRCCCPWSFRATSSPWPGCSFLPRAALWLHWSRASCQGRPCPISTPTGALSLCFP